MNRVTALAAVMNDTARSDAERQAAIKVLYDISTNSPDAAERMAASRMLPDQSSQDEDLERALQGKTFPDYRSYSSFVDELSEDTHQLLSDINDPLLLGLPPYEGGLERLKSLCARTQSAFVKAQALDAIQSTEKLLAKGLKMIPRPRKAEVAHVAA